MRHQLFLAALLAGISQIAIAQPIDYAQPGDPARWYREIITPQQRAASGRIEAAAALRENLADCRQQGAGDRGACARAARETYRQEMLDARNPAR